MQSPKAKVVIETKPKPTTHQVKQATEPSTKVMSSAEKKEDLRMTYTITSTTGKEIIKGDTIRKSVLSPNCKPNFKLPEKEAKEPVVVSTHPTNNGKTKAEHTSGGHGEVPKSPNARLHPSTITHPKPKVQVPQPPKLVQSTHPTQQTHPIPQTQSTQLPQQPE